MLLGPAQFIGGALPNDPAADESDMPAGIYHIGAFKIARAPVTVGEFRAFISKTGYAPAAGCWVWGVQGWSIDPSADWAAPGFPQGDDHPVVCVSYGDALAYARWKGGRLLNETEWEFAARGGSRAQNSWGGRAEDGCAFANLPDIAAKNKPVKVAVNCDDGFIFTAPVGQFRPNGYGLSGMQGNVWTWTSSCYHEAGGQCTERIKRGGAWYDGDGPPRLSMREWAAENWKDSFTGFRLAFD